MTETPTELVDVVIVGAGPVGLLLACELRLANISVLVLEQAADPDSPLKGPPFGMRGLSVPTIEAFDRRGLLQDIAPPPRANDDGGTPSPAANTAPPPRRQFGHFAGIPFDYDNVDTAKWSYRLPGAVVANMGAEMQRIESMLAIRAELLGANIMRGVSVDRIEKSDTDVTVHSTSTSVRARWLVGCDGGRSTVRKTAGFEFVGTDAEFTGYSVQVDMAEPNTLAMGRHYTPTGMYFQSRPGTIAMVEFDGGAFHRSQPVTLDHVQSVLRRVACTDVTVTALHIATTWTDRAFQTTTYRNGRVLLAGDAAHIHSPLGGQGLNLGIGDAMNLGWKLAATIRGDAPVDLLDSYTTERHPIGAQVLDWSRAQVALMRPTPHARALEAIIRDLMNTRDGATYFAERVGGVGLRYDFGDAHALVGRSAPNFELSDGRTVNELLRDGRGLLLEFDAAKPLAALASRYRDHVSYVASEAHERMGLSAMLVRPDGFVAWVGESPANVDDASRALSRWFGERDRDASLRDGSSPP